ncbi:MAG: hypothetical protein IKQ31_05610 [Clostridia bacterium]|nr:hypothetical protein [Clostridia bacterium]MBR4271127.1 hypothetical protein [Clostridia bacterium]
MNKYNNEESFNEWFISFVMSANSIEEAAEGLTDRDVIAICEFAEWEQERVLAEDKRNTIYLYALRLLFLYEDAHILYDFLHSLNPYLK